MAANDHSANVIRMQVVPSNATSRPVSTFELSWTDFGHLARIICTRGSAMQSFKAYNTWALRIMEACKQFSIPSPCSNTDRILNCKRLIGELRSPGLRDLSSIALSASAIAPLDGVPHKFCEKYDLLFLFMLYFLTFFVTRSRWTEPQIMHARWLRKASAAAGCAFPGVRSFP